MSEFRMPALGADMEDGTLVEWLRAPGDTIHRGDIIAVVETVKGAIEIECFENGILDKIVVSPGATVAVGDVLAQIKEEGRTDVVAPEPRTKPISESPDRAVSILSPSIAAPSLPIAAMSLPPRRISPAARKRAQQLGLDIETVQVGPGGVIGLAEVAAAQHLPQPSTAETPQPVKRGFQPDGMRRAIGAAMARSKREIPHYYVSSTLDLSLFTAWLEDANTKRSTQDRLLYAAPLIKAVAVALRSEPALNGVYVKDNYQPSKNVHVGVATALRGGGLIAPAIHDADTLTPDEAMARLRELIPRVRAGRIRGSEMTDPTITLSILGEGTADSLHPVIYPPQVAIIGCGAMRERPWVVDGAITVRRVMTVTVAGDHRVSDGRSAARFLNRLDKILQEPQQL